MSVQQNKNFNSYTDEQKKVLELEKKYFDIISWKRTVKKTKLKENYFEKNFQQHVGLFNFILHKKHHFISVLKK